MKKRPILLISVFLIIIILIIIINLIYIIKNKNETNNIKLENNNIDFNSLTLKQKIAQMIVVRGDDKIDPDFTNQNVGGIFLDRQKSEEDYIKIISKNQNNSKIKLFVTTDMEGAWNPFTIFTQFPSFSEINSSEEAYKTGLDEGLLLKRIGFNLNFAPVAEYSDKSYGGRAFLGNKSEIKSKLKSYITGLQKNTLGTCKHFPGKGMINNLHLITDKENITNDDLELFNDCINNNISSIMIGHQITEGKIESFGKPSSVSKEVISSLGNFSGLIISDEINMQGLKSLYKNKVDIYRDLINSGDNVILDFDLDSKSLDKLTDSISKMVYNGTINGENINKSVKKILIAKGYKIK